MTTTPSADPAEFFAQLYGRAPQVRTSAPGRVEFIGNHVDYNGGRVMGAAIDRCVRVALSPSDEPLCRFHSSTETDSIDLPTGELQSLSGSGKWAQYAAGVYAIMKELGMPLPVGFDLTVASDLPVGSGLSSSAALINATGLAFGKLAGKSFEPIELARLSRRVENEFVGVPVGLLDMTVSAAGKQDHIVLLDCDTQTVERFPILPGLRIWVFDSGSQHRLVDSFYADRRKECESAFAKMQPKLNGVKVLAHVTPEQLQKLEDDLTEDERKRARHVVHENARVQEMEKALPAGEIDRVGQLLVASHSSSRDLFENSTPALDLLVELLAAQDKVVGARLTGGGFGGSVMALAGDSFTDADATAVAKQFADRTGFTPSPAVFAISDGARVEG